MFPVTLQRTKQHTEQFTYTEERISYGPSTLWNTSSRLQIWCYMWIFKNMEEKFRLKKYVLKYAYWSIKLQFYEFYLGSLLQLRFYLPKPANTIKTWSVSWVPGAQVKASRWVHCSLWGWFLSQVNSPLVLQFAGLVWSFLILWTFSLFPIISNFYSLLPFLPLTIQPYKNWIS